MTDKTQPKLNNSRKFLLDAAYRYAMKIYWYDHLLLLLPCTRKFVRARINKFIYF